MEIFSAQAVSKSRQPRIPSSPVISRTNDEVISACNTAAADKIGAQALSGLARAFFYAGGRALLVSHWPVYSDAAVRLTTSAFAELDRNPKAGRAEALQNAMITLMDDHSQADNAHPAVWAPFVVVGEGAR